MPTSTEFNRIQLDLRPTSEEAKSVPPAAPNQTKSVAVTIAARQDRRLAGVLPVRRNQARCRCVLARRARYTKKLELAVYVRVHFPPLHSIHRSGGWRKKRCMKAPPEHFVCGSATGERVHARVRSVMGWAPPIPPPPVPHEQSSVQHWGSGLRWPTWRVCVGVGWDGVARIFLPDVVCDFSPKRPLYTKRDTSVKQKRPTHWQTCG